ncbi:MAG: hypothetical protein NPIRA02_40230 [Nitrospirales bacterium]|nr:MAG: hypothetical protein NPIRA02_40230 [Nitrospirales bacterium]
MKTLESVIAEVDQILGPPAMNFEEGRHIQLIRGDTIRLEATFWSWEGRIPHCDITVLCGDPDVGKTMLAMDLAARWTRGQNEGVFQSIPVDVLIASAEDSPSHTLIPRLSAAGADLTKVHIIKMKHGEDDAGGLSLPEDITLLHEHIKRVNAKILIIDPLMSHLGEGLNANKDQDIRKAMGTLPVLAQNEELTILIICHLNKNESASSKYRIGGSIGIFAVPRSVLLAGENPEREGEFVLAHLKCNVGEKAKTQAYAMESRELEGEDGVPLYTGGIVWKGDVEGVTPESMLTSKKDPEEQSALEFAEEWLKDFLDECDRAAEDVLKAARRIGISERTLNRAKKSLGIGRRKEGFGKDGTWMWSLAFKGCQAISKGCQTPNVGNLKASAQKKTRNYNMLLKGCQASDIGNLSNGLGNLSAEVIEDDDY